MQGNIVGVFQPRGLTFSAYPNLAFILGLAFASGLAATVTITHLLKAGDQIICMDDVYGGRWPLSCMLCQLIF